MGAISMDCHLKVAHLSLKVAHLYEVGKGGGGAEKRGRTG